MARFLMDRIQTNIIIYFSCRLQYYVIHPSCSCQYFEFIKLSSEGLFTKMWIAHLLWLSARSIGDLL